MWQMSSNEMFENVDEEPALNPIKQTAQFQEQKKKNSLSDMPKINQLYNPLNSSISEEDSNPWANPSFSIYVNSDLSTSQSNKTTNTNFVNLNQGNEKLPLYIRPVSAFFPVSNATRQLTFLPIGMIISPGIVDQQHVPITDLNKSSLIRCPRCAAHISPYCKISPDGKHWKCGICGNDTIFLTGNVQIKEKSKAKPSQINSPLSTKTKEIKTIADLYSHGSSNINNSIITHEDRLEITSPFIDIIAPQNYNVHENAGPSFLFIFDLSVNSLIHRFAQTMAASVISIINEISDDTYISLITIDDNLTIYDFEKNNRTAYPELEPEILKDELSAHVCKLKDQSGSCRNYFISALKEIQNIQIDTSNLNKQKARKGNCIGSAFEVVPHILNGIGGIVVAFIFGTCDVGPRAVSKRSNDEMINEKEILHMPKTQASAFYGGIARLYARSMISLHLFAASSGNDFVDLAVLGVPCGLTGGRCHFFKGFDALIHYSEIHREIYRTLTMRYFWDATLRLRLNSSLSIARIHANCQLVSQDTIKIPSIAAEDSFAFEFAIHMHIPSDNLIFQFELEWNDENRRRMIRIFNFSIPVTDDPLRILKGVDVAALTTILMKRAISPIFSTGAVEAAKIFVQETKQIHQVVSFNTNQDKSSQIISKNQINYLLFPNFKSFPKITYGLLKSSFLSANFPNGSDGRFSQLIQMRSIGIVDLILFIYPRLLTINNEILPLSKVVVEKYIEKIDESKSHILILHSCNAIFIWAKSRELLVNELESGSSNNVIDQNGVINVDTINDQKLKDLIKSCWIVSRKYLLSFAIYGGEILNTLMIDDSITSEFNYSLFLQSFDMAI